MTDAIKEEVAAEIQEQESEQGGLLGWLGRIANGVRKERHEETLDWTLDGDGVTTISAATTNGSVKFTASDDAEIVVKARKVVKAADLATAQSFSDKVQIHVERDGDQVNATVEHPKPPRGVGVEVSFTVTAPRTINIVGKTINGSARVEQFHSRVEAETTNGSVQVKEVAGHVQAQTTNGDVRLNSVSGPIEAKTTNGSLKANAITIAEVANFTSHNGTVNASITGGDAPLTATTHNGSVRLTLPTTHEGAVTAQTHNGSVRCALPIEVTRQSRTKLEGRIGSRETPIVLNSHNGSITLAGHE